MRTFESFGPQKCHKKTARTSGALWLMLASWIFAQPFPAAGQILSPEQLLIVANRAYPKSVELARYYMQKRKVPAQNLVRLKTSEEEYLGREEYEREIASPVRDFLAKNDPEGRKFACIVLVYGIPLRIDPPRLSGEEEMHLKQLRQTRADLNARVQALEKTDPKQAKLMADELSAVEQQIQRASKSAWVASVDSEIALVMEKPYPQEGWLPNRFFVGFRGKEMDRMPQRILVTSRIDGPSDTIVRRIIDDAMQAEEQGLAGTAYFDARWPDQGDKNLSTYQTYDRSIHNAARAVEKSQKMKVVVDEKEALFQPGQAPDAALYCGWYSYGSYVDAFTWARGAVGFHVASAECTTLKSKASRVWCKVMLEKGVTATLGPVTEPYLQSFPPAEAFFGCLVGGYTLAQCYAASNPFWSWQMVLIGDPLYRPFKSAGGAKQ